MSRGFGELDFIQGVLPDWTAVIFAALTQLGDAWFLGALLVGLYWGWPEGRDEVLLVIGMVIAGTGLYRSLKHFFELPRPGIPLLDPAAVPSLVRPLYEGIVVPSSFGFPSGHATGVAVVYLGLAAVLDVGSRRGRYAAASAIIAVVSFTRVVLGVHYLVDVIAGAALGSVVVVLGIRGARHLSRDRVTVVLAAGILTTFLYLFESAAHLQAVLTVGGALGLFGGWQLVVLTRPESAPAHAAISAPLRRGLAAASGLFLLALLAASPLRGEWSFALGAVAGVVAAGIVLLPSSPYFSPIDAAFARLRT